MSAKVHMLINHENTNEIAVRIKPNMSAFFGETLPDGIGLPLVLSIIASISRSLYPVSVSAAAEPAATPPISKIQVNGRIGILNNKDAVSADPNVVKTSRYQIFGFVSS
jgi:hypothetical protein